MALENYRITEFQEKTQVDNGDYVLIDSATDGTHKYQLSRIPAQASAEVAAAVSTEANTRHQADMDLMQMINQERSDRAAADGALQSSLSQDIANVASTLGSAVSSEAGARAAADAALNNAIEAETTAREEAVTALAESVEAEYAKKDGSYADMTAGNADQLLSTVGAVDSVPYLFRKSGGTADIGDREYDEIVGGTVAWNQLVKSFIDSKTINGITFTANGGAITVSGTATSNAPYALHTIPLYANHLYFLKGCPSGGGGTEYALYMNNMTTQLFDIGAGSMQKPATDTTGSLYFIVYSGQTIDFTFIPQLFDVTQMFGSTIADYIYSLETATAGAGVAFFRSLFPNDYYPYDAGSLKSVEGLSAHETVGFNAWDEEWEVGSIDGNTGAVTSGSYGISKNKIHVIPNVNYCLTRGAHDVWLYFYDADGNFFKISNAGYRYVPSGANLVTIPEKAHYMRFLINTTYGTTYKNDICINLSWSGYRNGEYEPYVKHTYPLDDSLTLRGIPKLDASNHLYYDGDTYEADGTVTKRYGIVDLGTLTWVASSSRFNTTTSISGAAGVSVNLVCDRYISDMGAYTRTVDKSICITNGGYIYIYDTSQTGDETAFKTAMSGVYLVYELATPTTEEADPYQSPQIVDDFGTEEYVTTSIVPVGHYTKYPENLRAKIEGLPWDFSTLIAPTEKTNTATRNYTSGSLLIMGNVLYKVTANIANGGTITPGTNVTATTLSEVILALA